MSFNTVKHAISLLQEKGIPAEMPAYGFSLQHSELEGRNFGECGFDNDGSISLSVNIDEDPAVAWFFRISFVEMAQFIIEAYAATGKTKPSRYEIVTSMRALDALYDDTKLNKVTAKFMNEIEDA